MCEWCFRTLLTLNTSHHPLPTSHLRLRTALFPLTVFYDAMYKASVPKLYLRAACGIASDFFVRNPLTING